MSLLNQGAIKQNINLYLPRFRPAQLSQAMGLLVKITATIFILVLLSTILLASTQLFLQSQLDRAQQEQQALSYELDSVLAQVPSMTIDKTLQKKIEREKEVLDKQKRVISFLRQDSISDSASFTPLVEQLSLQSVKGVWLSRFEVIHQGQDIQLFGFAKTPNKVSQYLTMLGNQEAYQGLVFKQIQVQQGQHAWSEFFLSTQEKKEDAEESFPEIFTGVGL